MKGGVGVSNGGGMLDNNPPGARFPSTVSAAPRVDISERQGVYTYAPTEINTI